MPAAYMLDEVSDIVIDGQLLARDGNRVRGKLALGGRRCLCEWLPAFCDLLSSRVKDCVDLRDGPCLTSTIEMLKEVTIRAAQLGLAG